MSSPASLSRARAGHVDKLVLEVARAMAAGSWVPGESHAAMAEREGVSIHTAKDWATDAGRLLRLLDEDDAQAARAANRATLAAIVADARRDGDHGAAVRGVEAQNKLLGLNAPERQQVEHTDQRAQLEAMAPLDAARWAEDQAARLLAFAKAKRAEAGVVEARAVLSPKRDA